LRKQRLTVVSSQLKRAIMVDRVDQNGDHVLLYIKEVRAEPSASGEPTVRAHRVVCSSQQLEKDLPIFYRLDLIQELRVGNLKPAVVKIYDYYQPSKTRRPPRAPPFIRVLTQDMC